jgi:hypothetical protein
MQAVEASARPDEISSGVLAAWCRFDESPEAVLVEACARAAASSSALLPCFPIEEEAQFLTRPAMSQIMNPALILFVGLPSSAQPTAAELRGAAALDPHPHLPPARGKGPDLPALCA